MQPPATISGESEAETVRSPLILVGASVRAAAQSAQTAGFSVIGIDLFGDTDTLRACDRYHRLPTNEGEHDEFFCEVDEDYIQVRTHTGTKR